MTRTNEEVFTTWTKDLEDSSVSVAYLCGELDASSVPTLLDYLHPLVGGDRNVVVDAHLLSYIDSTGLSALLSIKQALERSGRGLCIVGAHGLLTKILQVTRADHEFQCYETMDEALDKTGQAGWQGVNAIPPDAESSSE
jgi:anti-sigma B factor antagonist